MSSARNQVQAQINLIQQAMKEAGVWCHEAPSWVQTYKGGPIPDIWNWLQFIQLPMRLADRLHNPGYLAPQLIRHMKETNDHQNILQLVIELDSLTSTLEKQWKE